MVLRRLLALLVLTTLLGLYANAHWMTRTLRIDGSGAGQQVSVIDDRSNGGRSEARLLPGRTAGMECRLSQAYEWPYCELHIKLDDAGLDLSRFASLRLWLRADGPVQGDGPRQVRVFLRNFNPHYAGNGPDPQLKPHEVVFAPGEPGQPVEFRLGQFMVTSWWAQAHPLPVALMGPELDRVRLLTLATGGQAAPGLHHIELERAELVGQWVSAENFRLGLIGLWMSSLLGYLAWEAWTVRGRLQRTVRGERALRHAHTELQRRSVDLEQMALCDGLTRVSNREGLTRDLQQLLQAEAFPLAVVFVDLDHFKQVNDGHGHEVGDEVLVAFAQLLRANLPRDDLLARWGGEEFVIVMPRTAADAAVAVAQRLRQVLAQAAWPAGLQVTASWGVAEALSDAGLEAALRAADQAMYRAKREGRDRVARA